MIREHLATYDLAHMVDRFFLRRIFVFCEDVARIQAAAGFSHICGKTRMGRFRVLRQTLL
jgi:hypothetical protein